MRINWDKYEAAILLDYCLKIQNGSISKKDAVSVISKMLRQKAINTGINIDDVFRNENGISWQINFMLSVLNQDDSLGNHSRLFEEIYKLYREDNNEYLKLVEESIDMCTEITSKKSLFFKWMSDTKNISVNLLDSYDNDLQKVEKVCKKYGILSCSIYDIDDDSHIVDDIRNIITRNVMFTIVNRRIINRIYDAVNLLFEYLSTQADTNKEENDSQSEVIEQLDAELEVRFYNWLKNELKLADPSCRSYASAINSAEKFAKNHHMDDITLYTFDAGSFTASSNRLMNNEEFAAMNQKQHNRYKNAFSKYLTFIECDDAVNSNSNSSSTSHAIQDVKEQVLDEELCSRISFILENCFPYGCRVSSFIELNKFRKQFFIKYQINLDCIDEELAEQIKKCGMEFDSKVYVVSNETRDWLKKSIETFIDTGMIIFYYEKLYLTFENELNENHIFSVDMLKSLVDEMFDSAKKRAGYICFDSNVKDESSAIISELNRIWNDDVLMSYSEIYEALPYIPEDKIKFSLSYCKQFIWNSEEVFANVKKLNLEDNVLDKIYDFIKHSCSETGCVSFSELPLEDFMESNYMLSSYAVWDIIKFYVVKNDFDINGKVITEKGKSLSLVDVFRNYSIEHKMCTYDELVNLSYETTGSARDCDIIYAGNMAMIRIDKEKFVSEDMVEFNVDAIDKAMEEIIDGDYIVLRDVTAISLFPSCGCSWSLFVLENFCRRFSKQFKYDCIVPNSKSTGVIAKKSSSMTYQDMMIDSLSKTGKLYDDKSALDYFYEKGFIGRRVYSEISEIVNKSNEIVMGRS